MSKYGVFSGPYFLVFGTEKTLYLDSFHPVLIELGERSRRNNSPIDGIKEEPTETWAACEKKSKYYYG